MDGMSYSACTMHNHHFYRSAVLFLVACTKNRHDATKWVCIKVGPNKWLLNQQFNKHWSKLAGIMSSERLEEYEDNLKSLLRDLETQISITLPAVTGGSLHKL